MPRPHSCSHVCGTRCPDAPFRTARKADPGDTLYVRVLYTVITGPGEDVLPIDRLRAQHVVVSDDFAARNADLANVPATGRYGFRGRVGTADVQFLPLDPASLVYGTDHVRQLLGPAAFSGIAEAAAFAPPRDGWLNVYVNGLEGNVLGQAYVGSNLCTVRTDTVGGPEDFEPDFPLYGMGRTLTHEVGHVFGLRHSFTGNCTPDFADIPAQRLPNFEAEMDDIPSDTALDNHYRDCNAPLYPLPGETPPYSCSADCAADYEMFFNFMDYGNDRNAVMFTTLQAVAMRQYVLGSDLGATPGSEPVPADKSTSVVAWVVYVLVLVTVLAAASVVLYYARR
jgi:hypothetical protein